MENGTAPATAGVGVVPTGMAGFLPEAYTRASPMGGVESVAPIMK